MMGEIVLFSKNTCTTILFNKLLSLLQEGKCVKNQDGWCFVRRGLGLWTPMPCYSGNFLCIPASFKCELTLTLEGAVSGNSSESEARKNWRWKVPSTQKKRSACDRDLDMFFYEKEKQPLILRVKTCVSRRLRRRGRDEKRIACWRNKRKNNTTSSTDRFWLSTGIKSYNNRKWIEAESQSNLLLEETKVYDLLDRKNNPVFVFGSQE